MAETRYLNLTDVNTEDFETIKKTIEDWKADGMIGKFGYLTEEETQEAIAVLKQAFAKTYKKGVLHGGLALIGGFALGTMIHCAVEHFTTKEEKEVK